MAWILDLIALARLSEIPILLDPALDPIPIRGFRCLLFVSSSYKKYKDACIENSN